MKSAKVPSGRSSAASCSIPYRNSRTRIEAAAGSHGLDAVITFQSAKAMRPVTGSASTSRTRAVSPGRSVPVQRASTGGSCT